MISPVKVEAESNSPAYDRDLFNHWIPSTYTWFTCRFNSQNLTVNRAQFQVPATLGKVSI